MDRNLYYGDGLRFADGSLSARRAWIEIITSLTISWISSVALRKESVDRNMGSTAGQVLKTASLSARRAWIEIVKSFALAPPSVSRSPQGERG